MKRSLPKIAAIAGLLSVLILSACTTTNQAEIGTPYTEEEPVPSVWQAVEAWAPAIAWLPPKAGITSDNIIIDDTPNNTIPAGAIQAESIEASINQATFNSVFMAGDSRAALDAVLEADGWVRHLPIDADGALGTTWGYRREAAEGLRFLIVSASEWQATVTVTTAIAPGDDL